MAPTGTFNKYNPIPHYFGKKNDFGGYYNVRNVFFEPENNPNIDCTIPAIARIHAAFLMKRPAVISARLVNFASVGKTL